MSQLSKEIWQYLIQNQITITAEYLTGSLNTIADWESMSTRDSSKWKLNPSIFRKICQKLTYPSVDLFASRLSFQVKRFVLLLETRPIMSGSGCISTGLVSVPDTLCVSSICSSTQSAKETTTRQSSKVDSHCASLAEPKLVSGITPTLHRKSHVDNSSAKPAEKLEN